MRLGGTLGLLAVVVMIPGYLVGYPDVPFDVRREVEVRVAVREGDRGGRQSGALALYCMARGVSHENTGEL